MNTHCTSLRMVFLFVSMCCGLTLPLVSMSASSETAQPESSISNLPATGETKEESTIKHAPVTGLSRTTESVEHREGSEPNGSHLSTTTLPPNSSVRQPVLPNSPNPEPVSSDTPTAEIHTKDIKPPHVFNQQQTIKQPAEQVQQFREATKRFELLLNFNNDAVLDRKTSLVWERSPSVKRFSLVSASAHCQNLTLANHGGWALPQIEQLQSLVDVTQSNPALPSGHPFKNVQSDLYQSATINSLAVLMGGHNQLFVMNFKTGIGATVYADVTPDEFLGYFVWCVRSGQGGDPIPVPTAGGKLNIGSPVWPAPGFAYNQLS